DAPARIPVVRAASVPASDLEARARRLVGRAIGAPLAAAPTVARIGGGAAPMHQLPSWGVRVKTDGGPALCSRLRDGDPAIVARIEADDVVLDLRCIPPEEDARLLAALLDAIAWSQGEAKDG